MTPPNFRRVSNVPRIYGHRGASAHAPENTMKAFALAFEHDADGVELDVRLAKTGEVVVFHDATLDRTTDSRGRVSRMSLSELRQVDLGEGERMPLLDDVLDLASGCDRILNIEAKTDDVDRLALARALAKAVLARPAHVRERLFFSTFHPDALRKLRAHAQEIPCAFLFEANVLGRTLGVVAPYGWKTPLIHPHYDLVTPERIAHWQAQGVTVNTWTVDDAYEIGRLCDLGIDGLITNDPRRTRAIANNLP
jgi:glycerophosphoryl diester phosphodiesterase